MNFKVRSVIKNCAPLSKLKRCVFAIFDMLYYVNHAATFSKSIIN